MAAQAALIVWLLFGLAGLVISERLARRIWTRRHELGRARTRIASVVAAFTVLGAAGTVLGMLRAFGAMLRGANGNPGDTARLLAEGIAQAMNWTAFCLVVWIPSIVITLVLTRHRKARDP